MKDETIKVRVIGSGDHIQVVLGQGVHDVTCDLTPTRTGQAYADSLMRREIVYERPKD
jgi:hypothetical protein